LAKPVRHPKEVIMKRLVASLFAVGALALSLVTILPGQADAGWRRGWGYGGPGVGIYVGPGYGYYGGYGYARPYGYYGGYYPYAYYPYWRGPAWRRWGY
jgi:hypothetical protein